MNRPAKTYRQALCLSRGIARVPGLAHFTGAHKHRCTWGINHSLQARGADLLVDWGNKRQDFCRRVARRTGADVLRLEDGFIRSLGLGVDGSRSLSVVSDWSGIYYDARQPCDLEDILNNRHPLAEQIPGLVERARRCIELILEQRISKYNHAPELELAPTRQRRILLVDQTAGDLSIAGGLAGADSFQKMLTDALREPDTEILIKTHPDVLSGKKQGYLGNQQLPAQVRLITESCNPLHLIEQVDEVWCVTSQMGFEACLCGKKVRCYGMPFYAGWGITDDRQKLARRQQRRSLEDVFAAAYLLYCTYFDPDTGEISNLETLLEHIARQKHYWRANRGQFICLGFDRWKHSYVRDYLRSDNNCVEFKQHLDADDLANNPQILVWGNNAQAESVELAKTKGLSIATMEDGFIRSVNLGKYGTAPRSLVVDQGGIYYAPDSGSDLEQLLASAQFSRQELEQAQTLRQTLIAGGLSKYNVGSLDAVTTAKRPEQKLILVPGQVGIDASIVSGCDQIRTNMALLEEVRRRYPDDYILFKPHPDVVSGNIVESGDYGKFADQVEPYAHIHSCLAIADQVHTMTSLVGFEALLRNIETHVYGRPFYAGWGLTIDHSQTPMPRRKRVLELEELVAGVYLRYPRYINPQTGEFTTALRTVQALQKEITAAGTTSLSNQLWQRWYLKARYGGWGILKSLGRRR